MRGNFWKDQKMATTMLNFATGSVWLKPRYNMNKIKF